MHMQTQFQSPMITLIILQVQNIIPYEFINKMTKFILLKKYEDLSKLYVKLAERDVFQLTV